MCANSVDFSELKISYLFRKTTCYSTAKRGLLIKIIIHVRRLILITRHLINYFTFFTKITAKAAPNSVWMMMTDKTDNLRRSNQDKFFDVTTQMLKNNKGKLNVINKLMCFIECVKIAHVNENDVVKTITMWKNCLQRSHDVLSASPFDYKTYLWLPNFLLFYFYYCRRNYLKSFLSRVSNLFLFLFFLFYQIFYIKTSTKCDAKVTKHASY